MKEKIKAWAFRRCFLICGNDAECAFAQQVVDDHGAVFEREKGLVYRMMVKTLPPFYRDVAKKIYVVRAHDVSDAKEILQEFNALAGGYVVYNPEVA